MASNAQFSRQLKRFIKKDVKEGGTRNIRKIALAALNLVVTKSPIDKGTFKGNWNVGIGTKNISIDKSRRLGNALSEGKAVIGSYTSGKIINISNALPYANKIEFGWSDQAPAGVVRVTEIELERKLRNIRGSI